MAMIEELMYQHLVNNTPMVSGRVYANRAAQDSAKPLVIYTVNEERTYSLDGSCESKQYSWTVFCYHTEYLLLKQLKNEVADSLPGFGHNIASSKILIEDAFDEQAELDVQVIKFTTKEY